MTREGGVIGINRTVMTLHTIADVILDPLYSRALNCKIGTGFGNRYRFQCLGQIMGRLRWLTLPKVSSQDIHRATARVSIRHLLSRHLYPQGAYLEQDSVQAIREFIRPLPPNACSGTPPAS